MLSSISPLLPFPSIMQFISALLLVGCSVCFFAVVSAKDDGDACFATVECADPGLVCTGARCVCIATLDPEHGQIWGCNSNEDCNAINVLAAQGLTSAQRAAAHAPVCTASTQCPALKGKSGYCDVSLNA